MDLSTKSILEQVVAGLLILIIIWVFRLIMKELIKIKPKLIEGSNIVIQKIYKFLINGGVFLIPISWGLFMVYTLLTSGPEVEIDKNFIGKTMFFFSYIILNIVFYIHSNVNSLKIKVRILEVQVKTLETVTKFLETKYNFDYKLNKLDKNIEKLDSEIKSAEKGLKDLKENRK